MNNKELIVQDYYKDKDITSLKTYTFVQYKKVKLWNKIYLEIKAESEQDAIDLIQRINDPYIEEHMGSEQVFITDSEFLYETEEVLTPEENYGKSTVELKTMDDILLVDNSSTI